MLWNDTKDCEGFNYTLDTDDTYIVRLLIVAQKDGIIKQITVLNKYWRNQHEYKCNQVK